MAWILVVAIAWINSRVRIELRHSTGNPLGGAQEPRKRPLARSASRRYTTPKAAVKVWSQSDYILVTTEISILEDAHLTYW